MGFPLRTLSFPKGNGTAPHPKARTCQGAADPRSARNASPKGVRRLKYINAKEVLPEQLLTQLQEYVQGTMIYIPGRDAERAAWGESNGTRAQYLLRNREIIQLYRKGSRVDDLADRYHLSPCSIRKIVHGKAGHEMMSRLVPEGRLA